MNTANIFHMYFKYNHMFFAESASGFAREKGEIKKTTLAINTVKGMVHQMICLIDANLKYSEEFDVPIRQFVRNKYHL